MLQIDGATQLEKHLDNFVEKLSGPVVFQDLNAFLYCTSLL